MTKASATSDINKTHYRTVDVDGVKIFYREAGATGAPVVLLLHGWPSSSRMFEKLIPTLADRYRAVAPDYPAFGHSETPDRETFSYTFDNFADVVDAFAEKLGLDRYALYVHDFGGPVGYRIALRHPERVLALIVQNAPAYQGEAGPFWTPVIPYWQDGSAEHRERVRAIFTIDGTRTMYLTGAHDPSQIDPDNWLIDQTLMDRPGVKDIMLEMFYGIRNNHEIFPALHDYFRQYQPPTLIVHGQNDTIFLPDSARAYLTDLPNAELHFLDTGHFALEEAGSEVAGLMNHFLDRNIPAKPREI
jgi:pimeloyl-ACP methyl ester carboxylesterase